MLFSCILMFNQIYNTQKRLHDDDYHLNFSKIRKMDNSFNNTYDSSSFVFSKNDRMASSNLCTSGGVIIWNNTAVAKNEHQQEKIRRSETSVSSLELTNAQHEKCYGIKENALLSYEDFNHLQSFDDNLLFSEIFQNVLKVDETNPEKASENKNENSSDLKNLKVDKVESKSDDTYNIASGKVGAIPLVSNKDQSAQKTIDVFDENLIKPNLLQSGINHYYFTETYRNQKKKKNMTSSEFINTLHFDVKQYIKYYISIENQEFYLKRLNDIADIFSSKNIYQEYLGKNTFFFINYEKKLVEKLFLIYKKLSRDQRFNYEVFDMFFDEFNLAMSKTAKSYHRKWTKLSRTEKDFIFHYEFIKLYKFVFQIPEIMTLLNNLKGKLCYDTTFMIHLINVFIEIKGDFEKSTERNLFIKFLLNRAFNFLNKKYSIVKSYSEEVQDNCCDFNFYTKLINGPITVGIEKKTGKNFVSGLESVIHSKIILLLFLYQHSVLLKSDFISVEDINAYGDLVERVIISNDIFIDIINEFIGLIQKQRSIFK